MLQAPRALKVRSDPSETRVRAVFRDPRVCREFRAFRGLRESEDFGESSVPREWKDRKDRKGFEGFRAPRGRRVLREPRALPENREFWGCRGFRVRQVSRGGQEEQAQPG